MEGVRVLSRRKTTVYTVTDASRPLSEDVDERQRRYLISMGVRMICFILAVALWGRVHPVLSGLLLVGAILLPYTSVIFANGGPKPTKGADLTDPSERRELSAPSGPAATVSGEVASDIPSETNP